MSKNQKAKCSNCGAKRRKKNMNKHESRLADKEEYYLCKKCENPQEPPEKSDVVDEVPVDEVEDELDFEPELDYEDEEDGLGLDDDDDDDWEDEDEDPLDDDFDHIEEVGMFDNLFSGI